METTKQESSVLSAYILLDRSGSMASRWDEALSSVNAYVDELKKNNTAARITVGLFDDFSGLSFDLVRKNVPVEHFEAVSEQDGMPRGSTPLFDAIGRISNLAHEAKAEKTVLVIMTDGYENTSRELNKNDVKKIIDSFKDKAWQIVFLGADFNAFGEAATIGVNAAQTLNMSAGNYGSSMRNVANQTAMYASSSPASPKCMAFSEKDRTEALKGNPSGGTN
jgi:uncharacterized protein YegL